ncbi:MAG: CRTAC1 family protein [Armatimonas sp.]
MTVIAANLTPWSNTASVQQISDAFKASEKQGLARIQNAMAAHGLSDTDRIMVHFASAAMSMYEAKPDEAYKQLSDMRDHLEKSGSLAFDWLFNVIFFQGVAGLRQGENENCVMCIGEGACILPISKKAIHQKEEGSRRAVTHFTEYLNQFSDDLEIRWLLNLAHMTLGEFPQSVDPKYVLSLDPYLKSEFDLGKFRDIAAPLGVNRLNAGGGGIMDDFDNDGRLDIVVSSWDATQPMGYFHNKGDGTFEDRTEAAGLSGQLGGIYCVQADYNNDGHLDILIVRGAWLKIPQPLSLLRNNGDGTFTDVTKEAGLTHYGNSISASWADYDNDGHLDLFVCCEAQPNRLYHNNGDGTFTEVAEKAGLAGNGSIYKGAAWIDSNNNGFPDLFVNILNGPAEFYRNNGDGTFTNVTMDMGIDGPQGGFSCWAWDYNNDGFLDIFATCYDHTVDAVVQGLIGQPHKLHSNKLFRNKGGKGFEDVTKEVGLDMVFATMGSNFGDIDNDGYLDFYLATGDPNFTSLVPNRLFKNVEGKRFAEITASSGTGNLQKGHGTAFGDWDNDGKMDLFVQMGGGIQADAFRNVLFQNPGNDNHSLTVKLVGVKTNRSAIGARIKVTTSGENPLTVYRLVGSGSSFGANPLQQTIGVGKATGTVTLEIHWPTSKTTQVFQNVELNQFIEVTEFAKDYKKQDRPRIPAPTV